MRRTSISVVIATLGGPSLAETIAQVNRGKLAPSEILICIPEEEVDKVVSLASTNVEIVRTNCRGQVAQRALGLERAQCPMVLQLDDDVHLPEDTLQLLVDALTEIGPGNVVAPVFYLETVDRPSHELERGFCGFVNNVITTIVCGAKWGLGRMGTVTTIGTSYGVDDRYCDSKKIFKTEWLPGGCLLSHKEDLVLDNFFPLPGKAFCEDLIHSHMRKQKGIHHFVIPAAKCMIEYAFPETNKASVLMQRRAQRYYANLVGGSSLRLFFYERLLTIKRLFRKM